MGVSCQISRSVERLPKMVAVREISWRSVKTQNIADMMILRFVQNGGRTPS